MFESRRNRSLILLEAVALIACLAILAGVPIGYSAASAGFEVPCTIDTTGNAWNGEIAFGVSQYNSSNLQQVVASYLVVMQTDNTQALNLLEATGPIASYANSVKYIAPDTLMVQSNNAASESFFWNFASNETTYFPNVYGHHDLCYDPVNNTFLALRDYVRNVNGTNYLFDTVDELNATGSILWSWDTYGNIPLTEADPFNDTAVVNGQTVVDFTHANALQWDYNDSLIYLNLRHTNTFYAINQTSGNIMWACGQFGNFTLVNAQGNTVSSLWYHSHDTTQVAPGIFIMFDNDFHNETNPLDAHSRILEISLDMQNMTAREIWSWEAPTSYWTQYWGSADILPNGDRLAVFGDPDHEFGQQDRTNQTGAIIVEVNATNDVVRTWTFPAGWGIYRVTEIDAQSLQLATTGVSSLSLQQATGEVPTQSQQPTSGFGIVSVSLLVVAVAIISIVAVSLYLIRKKKQIKI
ncbi:MAG: aryl-sulfate sulfotransferase [Candidatus Bathyarchaeia archaeon]|jgi:hypothetical protein